MSKEWCVCRHLHHISITLQTCHEGSLHQSGIEVVPLLACTMTSIFASKHLRAFAGIAVVAVRTTVAPTLLSIWSTQEPLLVAIEVLIHKVCTNLSHLRPQVLKLLTLRVRTTGTHNLDVWIFLSHLLHERLQVFRINLAPLLITDTHILQVERSWVSHVSTQLCPLVLGWVAVRELNQVEHIVNVRLQLIHWHMGIATIATILELARKTHTHHRQWFCTNLL